MLKTQNTTQVWKKAQLSRQFLKSRLKAEKSHSLKTDINIPVITTDCNKKLITLKNTGTGMKY